MKQKTQELLTAIDYFSKKGWSPATSTNYSFRDGSDIMISKSGVDKSQFTESDLIKIDIKGEIQAPYNQPGIKSSAETDIHLFLYEKFPSTQCVLHTHSKAGTYLSQKFVRDERIQFKGWEILKGLKGNNTHEVSEIIPIVANSQEMKDITNRLKNSWILNPHGFLIAGHGLYTWGDSIFEARRLVETFEFFFELKLLEMK